MAQWYIKKEMTRLYKPDELIGHNINGASTYVQGQLIEKIALSPKRIGGILHRAQTLYPEEYNKLKDARQVVNKKCRKTQK